MNNEAYTARGRYTGIRLDDTNPLTQERVRDARGHVVPPLTRGAFRLALELSAACREPNLTEWTQAGWMDIRRVADAQLAGSKLPRNLLNRLSGARREGGVTASDSDTARNTDPDRLKVLTMSKLLASGQFLIALNFAGTGARLFDWMTNFKMAETDGFHRGFHDLARQFEAMEPSLVFPGAARALHMDRLSLDDILQECRREDSRFRVILTGYSQGGAVMQIYLFFKLYETGVLAQNIRGYGFASPSCTFKTAHDNLFEAYPLYHIINSGDVVPRVGARRHYGFKLLYRGVYPPLGNGPEADAARAVRQMLEQATDTASAILIGAAFLQLLLSGSSRDIQTALRTLKMGNPVISKMAAYAERRAALSRFITRHSISAYQTITGTQPHANDMEDALHAVQNAVTRVGIPAFTAALARFMTDTHTLTTRRQNEWGSYRYIIERGFNALRVFDTTLPDEPGPIPVRTAKQPLRADKNGKFGYRRSRQPHSRKSHS